MDFTICEKKTLAGYRGTFIHCFIVISIISILISKWINFLFIFRAFWIIIQLIMLVFAGVLIHLLIKVYEENASFITRGNPIFVSQMAFPAVTICPNQAVLPAKISRLVQMS